MVAVLLGLVTACASSGQTREHVPAAPKPLVLTDADTRHLFTVRPGDRFAVVLHSTFWTFAHPTDTSVLDLDGTAEPTKGSACPHIPGTGCGTLTQHYIVKAAGTTDISAARTSCGEALACTPAQAHWQVRIRVR